MPFPRKTGEGGPAQYGRALREAGPLFGAGIQMAAAVVMMFFAGRWADDTFGTAPWLMLVGIFIGAAAGLVNFIRGAMSSGDKQTEKTDHPSNGPAE